MYKISSIKALSYDMPFGGTNIYNFLQNSENLVALSVMIRRYLYCLDVNELEAGSNTINKS